jgi:hypothetical protein
VNAEPSRNALPLGPTKTPCSLSSLVFREAQSRNCRAGDLLMLWRALAPLYSLDRHSLGLARHMPQGRRKVTQLHGLRCPLTIDNSINQSIFQGPDPHFHASHARPAFWAFWQTSRISPPSPCIHFSTPFSAVVGALSAAYVAQLDHN